MELIQKDGWNICPKCKYKWWPRIPGYQSKECPKCKYRIDKQEVDNQETKK